MAKNLSKSKFKLALECPTKLHYANNKEFYNNQLEDQFLKALAQGGYQVGELAKIYYPNGTEIEGLDIESALNQTSEGITKENVVLYEAAFQIDNLVIRADIFLKKGNDIQLLEVKAKSYSLSENIVNSRNKEIATKWFPYVYDLTFQTYVIQKCHPEWKISSSLLLVNKDSICTVEGLNQKFLITKDQNSYQVKVYQKLDKDSVGDKILIDVDLTDEVQQIIGGEINQLPQTFEDYVKFLGDKFAAQEIILDRLGKKCANCEFNISQEKENEGFKSGFKNCWAEIAKFKDTDFNKPSILDLWNYRNKDQFISENRYFLSDIKDGDLGTTDTAQRQKIQLEYTLSEDKEFFIDKTGLKAEFDQLTYPIHFIDFETTSVAIPFNKNRRPYEQIAFQFSHHEMSNDGTYSHKTEWINTERGVFPNFDFVRQLKNTLHSDEGSIFRYADHENSILNAIIRQLEGSNEKDRDELISWMKTITHSTSSSTSKWNGKRDMIDMLKWVQKYFYHPSMKGSNSIKAVLPAILNSSQYLKEKYSQPIYGKSISSNNFSNHTWVNMNSKGLVINPYSQLEPIHKGYDIEQFDNLLVSMDSSIQDGGTAMITYAKMQFSEMLEEEKSSITKSLLKYCELDTLSMVFIFEAWREWIKS